MGEMPSIDGGAKLFAIIGDPVAQVRSVPAFNRFFAARSMNAVMISLHVAAADIGPALAGLKRMRNFAGFVITMPHKLGVMAHLDNVLPRARAVGSVNAVRRRADGGLEGDMFDGVGMLIGVRASGFAPAGKRVLQIAAGGVGSAIAFAFAEAGVAAIRLHDLDRAKAEALRAALLRHHPAIAVDVGAPDPSGFDVVVNCSPLGMRSDDPAPIDTARLRAEQLVCDVAPRPEQSRFLAAARAIGCPIVDGAMLWDGQASEAARFFGLEGWPAASST
jgi:shikimate dehydrogenase